MAGFEDDLILPDNRVYLSDESAASVVSPASPLLEDTPPPSVSPPPSMPLVGGDDMLLSNYVDPMFLDLGTGGGAKETSADTADTKPIKSTPLTQFDLGSLVDDLDVENLCGALGQSQGVDAMLSSYNSSYDVTSDLLQDIVDPSEVSAVPDTPPQQAEDKCLVSTVKLVRTESTLGQLREALTDSYDRKVGRKSFLYNGAIFRDHDTVSEIVNVGSCDFVRVAVSIGQEFIRITDVSQASNLMSREGRRQQQKQKLFEQERQRTSGGVTTMTWQASAGAGASSGSILLQSVIKEEQGHKHQQFLHSQFAQRSGQHHPRIASGSKRSAGAAGHGSGGGGSGSKASRMAAKAPLPQPKAKPAPRFCVSEQFRRTTQALSYPSLVCDWAVPHVKEFARWARTAYPGIRINIGLWEIDGRKLVGLSDAEFKKMVMNDDSGLFFQCWVMLKKTNTVMEAVVEAN